MRIVQGLLAFAMALVPWAAASACSIGADRVRPSGFEQVLTSDAIVVATAREARLEERPTVFLDVDETLKGETARRIEVFGNLQLPAPADRSLPHIVYGRLGCTPEIFSPGARYMLFLKKDEAGILRRTHTMSSIAEEYGGPDSDQVRMVRRYVRIQATGSPMEQIAAVERLAATDRGLSGESLNPDEVEDLRYHLRSLSPDKPTAWLLAADTAIARGRLPAHQIREPGTDLATLHRRVLLSLAEGDHPGARPLFDRIMVERPEDPDRIGLALKYLARNGAYPRAFDWIETRLMPRLAQLDRKGVKRLIDYVDDVQTIGDEDAEIWREDPRSAARWPELALALYWYQIERFGRHRVIGPDSAIRLIPRQDYRARPRLSLALAADFDPDVAQWAKKELQDDAKRLAWESLPETRRRGREDPAELPLKAMLWQWQPDHEGFLEGVFCQSADRRRLLIRTLGTTADDLYFDLIGKIASSPLSAEERDLVPKAIRQWASRADPSLTTARSAARLLVALRRGSPGGTPVDCGPAQRRSPSIVSSPGRAQ